MGPVSVAPVSAVPVSAVPVSAVPVSAAGGLLACASVVRGVPTVLEALPKAETDWKAPVMYSRRQLRTWRRTRWMRLKTASRRMPWRPLAATPPALLHLAAALHLRWLRKMSRQPPAATRLAAAFHLGGSLWRMKLLTPSRPGMLPWRPMQRPLPMSRPLPPATSRRSSERRCRSAAAPCSSTRLPGAHCEPWCRQMCRSLSSFRERRTAIIVRPDRS